MAEKGIQPIVGCQVAVDFGDGAGRARAGRGARAPTLRRRADRRERGRLLEPRPARLRFLHAQPTPTTRAHVAIDRAGANCASGLIALTGGPGGPIDRAIAAGQAELAGARLDRLAAIFGDRLYVEIAAPRHAGRGGGRAGADRPRLRARPAAGGDQRALLPDPRRLRGPRRADRHRRRRGDRRRQPPAADAGALLQDRAPRWWRCSPTFRRRPRTRSKSPCAAPGGRSTRKPILPRFAGARRRPGGRPKRAEARAAARGGRAQGWTQAARRARPRAGADRGRLPQAARIRARRHREDEISGLLPDRRRLHPVGQGAGHPGRARARLGRRLGGRLVADHHRPRSAALRPDLRALPQSRPRVDAGLRRRLLPEPARRGHPLRPAEVRRRPGGADHHLRNAAGARRAARRRPRAADAVRPGRPPRQDGAAEPGQPGDAAKAHRRRAALRGGARRRPRCVDRLLDDRPEAGRALPPRLDPCRRHRHRRPAADRAGAALSRPALGHDRSASST